VFEIGVLVLSSLLFLAAIGAIIVMLKEFAHMRAAVIIMESACREHKEHVGRLQQVMTRGMENAEGHHTEVMEEYQKTRESNNRLQDRINRIEARQKKPMAPDVTFN